MAFLLAISLSVLASITSARTENVCITADCVQTASTILSSMDKSIDPCDDFYDYACGNWIKEHPIPDHEAGIHVLTLLSEKSALSRRSALEEPVSDMDIEATKKAKVFYKSCMDAEDSKSNWLRKMIDDLGGWPVLGDEPKVSLEHVLARMQVLTNIPEKMREMLSGHKPSGLMPVEVADDRALKRKFIHIDSPAVSFKNIHVLNEYGKIALLAYMTKVATLLGSEPAQADKDLLEVLEFEARLSKRISTFKEELDKNEEGKQLTLEELQEKVPQFNWTLYLQEVFQIKEELKQEDVIKVSLWTIVEMGDLLENTDRRLLQNYIVWNAIEAMSIYMTGELKKARDEFRRNPHPGTARWRECVIFSQFLFQKPVDYLYIAREPFDGEADIDEMFGGIKSAFLESLDGNTWMEEKSRSATREKILAINAYTAYSKEFYNISELNGEFEGVRMSPQNFIENVEAINALRLRNNWQSRKQPAQDLKWEGTASEVNAFYAFLSNKINIQAAIIKPPVYSSTFPKSMNYGGLGFTVGHELTHSVDSDGRRYDIDGNKVQWWDNKTIEAFDNRAKCIVEQYSAFKVGDGDDTYVNGEVTLGENIADNGAIKFAFRAYRKWVEKHGEETPLPGLDLSHDQLFFVNAAMGWCNSLPPNILRYFMAIDPHSPARARVMVPLRNSVDFATAFKCPLGSPMNPAHKCAVW